ncbi:MAG: hypothetical protein HY817_05535 [Candidatus Abawacabacteria bacterium]|nr:hypothetical protein [Candidatus Abawacabacteria bacterium]
MEKTAQLPTLKLADNIPVAIQFDGVLGKEYLNEQYGTKSYMYVVFDVGDQENKKVWFATEKQHAILQEAKVQPGKTYLLLKEKLPEEKYTQFKVRPLTEKELSSLNVSQQMNVSPIDQLAKELKSYQAAKKDIKLGNISPEAAAWALKTAVMAYDLFERNHLLHSIDDMDEALEYLAKKFLVMQKKLMHDI